MLAARSAPTATTTVLLADDHPALRVGLAAMLAAAPELQLVGSAANGAEALRLWRRLQPDLTLLDLRMPELDGFGALRAIRAESSTARLIALTTLEGDEDVYQALQAGANGYLLKDCEPQELLDCIRCVLRGQRYLQASAAGRLAERLLQTPLTPREGEVLRQLAAGLSNKGIARALGIGEGTVKFHVRALLDKLSAATRTEAVHVALQRGLLHP
jgi:two-component system NarL family response regulator